MHNYRSDQSAFMTRFGTDLSHQYGILGGKSQTSFSRNATRAGSKEGQLFSQASLDYSEMSDFIFCFYHFMVKGFSFNTSLEIICN